ncbi:MAG TPA: hypothetical protein VF733_01770 [Candidatus Saccharimonadales bacterium]
MGGALTECTQSLFTFPGDNTAGMIAFFTLDNRDPWYGWTNAWSFPYGESIGQPTHITAQTLFVPFWMLAKLVGPICSFNLLTLIGFMTAALTMFAFVRWLLGGKSWAALIAGFAVAFTPYLQVKTGVHISYVFEALFILTIWLFMLFWRDPRMKYAIPLGMSVALFAYTDGYFILLGGVLAAGLLIGAVVHDFWAAGRKISKELIRRLKYVGISVLIALACAAPVLFVTLFSSAQISESLTTTRDSIGREAQVYGARPLEYLLPNALNPVTDNIFGTYAERDSHGSNPAENLLSLSLVMIGLATFFVTRVILQRRSKKPILSGRFSPKFIAVVFGAVFVIAILVSLPPKLGPLPMPSFFLIEAVSLWRVFARLVVIANIALVVLGAFGLALLLAQLKKRWQQIGIVTLAFVIIFIEYLTFVPPRPVSGYEKVPELYYWLRTKQNIQTMAEYPLDEFAGSSMPVFYSTYQRIHGKKMLNGVMPNKQATLVRSGLRDLQSPQAVPGLRALGIEFVTIHDPRNPGDIPGLEQVHSSPESIVETDKKPGTVWGYRVLPGQKADYIVLPTLGWHAPVKQSPIHADQVMGHEGILGFKKIPHGEAAKGTTVDVEMRGRSLAGGGQEISILQNGKELWRGTVPVEQTSIRFAADAAGEVHVKAIKPTTDATLRFSTITVIE